MNRTKKRLIALAAAAIVAFAWFGVGGGPRTAARILDEAREMLADEHVDEQAVLRRFEEALQMAEEDGDREIAAEILSTRGTMLLHLGAVDSARRDFDLILASYRPGDPKTRRLLVRTIEAAGDIAGAVLQLDALLADQPDYGPAWIESGRLHRRLAEMTLEQCAEDLELALVPADAAEAESRLARLAAMDPLDPARTTVAYELRELVPVREEETLALCLVRADQASAELEAAREHYLRSFPLGLDPEAVAGFLGILVEAGELELAIDCGMVAMRRPAVAKDPRPVELLVRALLLRGDAVRAGTLADDWLRRDEPIDLEFLHLMSRALFAAEHWNGLLRCESRISRIGGTDDVELAQLYRGLALAGSGAGTPAMGVLRGWMRDLPDEPWPGAQVDVWDAMAKAAASARDEVQERLALNEVVRREPERDGQAWLRLAQLQMKAEHTSPQLPLRSLVHAMRLLPRRSAELEKQFRKLGALALERENKNLPLLFQDLAQQGRVLPLREPGPYELLRLAEMHRERAQAFGVITLAKQIFEEFPGFVPALDLYIDALLAMEETSQAAELAVQRLEATGPDGKTRVFFDRLSQFPFDRGQVVRILAADPEHAGRRRVAQHLREQGDPEGALRCLTDEGGSKIDPRELVSIAELLVDAGDHERALDVLSELPPRSAVARRALALRLSAALHAGDEETVRDSIQSVLREPGAEGPSVLSVGLLLLRAGETEKARTVLKTLDTPRARDGRGLFAAGLAALAAGELKAAATAIERSEAFLDPTTAELGRLLVNGRRGDWSAVERTARELEGRNVSAGTPADAARALLAGDPVLAAERALVGLAEDPLSSVWTILSAAAEAQAPDATSPTAAEDVVPAAFGPAASTHTRLFVRGSELFPHDPREVALLVLAIEQPLCAPYVAAHLQNLDPANYGELWPALLQARLLAGLGELGEARASLEQTTERFPTCAPAWRDLEAIERARVRTDDHPDLRALRERRLEAFGLASPESPEGLLLRAKHALAEGTPEAAATLASRALERRPAWPDAQALLAEALAAEGSFEESIATWRRACLEPSPAESKPWVAGYLRTLADAERAARTTRKAADTLTELEALAAHLPDDPRVTLAMAELELRRDPANPALGVARAYARLEAFRRTHEGTDLGLLASGATAEWARFYAALDPLAALRFLDAEREREPGNIDLWILRGSALRERGDLEGSIEALSLAGRMCAEPEASWELATTLVASAEDPRTVSEALERALALEEARERPFRAELLSAWSFVRRLEPGAWRGAAEALDRLWQRRGDASPAERGKAGLLYVQALLLRDDEGDRELALEVAAETGPALDDPYERAMLEALTGLASIPAPGADEGSGSSAALADSASPSAQ